MRGIEKNDLPRVWQVTVGLVLVVCGAISLATPVATSMTLTLLLGALFIVAGVAQLMHAFSVLSHRGGFHRFSLAALSIVVGVLLIRSPISGVVGITLLLAVFLFMASIVKFSLAMELRPLHGWGWLLASSVSSFILGLWLIITFPLSSLVVPGLFFGIDLIFYGTMLVVASWRGGVSFDQGSKSAA